MVLGQFHQHRLWHLRRQRQHRRDVATSRSGVTAASTNYCDCDSANGGSGATTQTCGTVCPDGSNGTYVSVTTKTTYTPIFPAMWGTLLTSNTLKLSATSVTRIN
jgi:hypothetical protein